MYIRETLGCWGKTVLIIVGCSTLAGVLVALELFVKDYFMLPEWTRWLFGIPTNMLISLLAVGGIMAVMRQFARQVSPAEQPIPDKSALSEAEQQVVSAVQLKLWLIAILCGIGFVVLTVIGLPSVQYLVYARSAETVFFVPVDSFATALPMLFFGSLFAGVSAEPICRRLAGERWLAIRDAVYEPLGYELSKRLNWLWFSAMGLVLLPALLSYDNYARFTEQGVYMNRFWSLREHFYPHSEVKAILRMTKFKNLRTGAIEPQESPYYEVHLRDGAVFSTMNLRHRYDDMTHQLMRWWSEKSGVPIREGISGLEPN